MMRWLLIALVTCCAACFGSAREDAVLATNTTQSVLGAVDEVWAPIVQQEIAKAKVLDDAGYKQALAPYLVVQEAIEQARRASQLMNLAVQTWDAQHDGGAMFQEIVPCVVQDLQLVRALLKGHEATAPPQLTQALNVIEATLSALAKPGAVCTPAKHSANIFAAPVALEASP